MKIKRKNITIVITSENHHNILFQLFQTGLLRYLMYFRKEIMVIDYTFKTVIIVNYLRLCANKIKNLVGNE